jgi:hypothetical protein
MEQQIASPQLAFDFGPDHIASNDPAYNTPLYKRSRNALYNSPEFRSVCRAAAIRAKHRCENIGCGSPPLRKLYYHHILPVEIYPDQFCVVSNIKCLCGRCHDNVTMQHAARHGWAYALSGR